MNNTPFLESPRFPEGLSYQSRGGPKYSTTITSVRSGAEVRNQNWTYPLHVYDASKENRSHAEMDVLINHFHSCAGMYYGFRFKDWADYRSCSSASSVSISPLDQTIGLGDDTSTEFQLIKTYVSGTNTRVRKIVKPVDGTVIIAFDDVQQLSGFSVDSTNGIVTFDSAPATGVVITAGYEFDVPVRFASDEFVLSWVDYGTLSTSIPLQEIR